MNCDSSESAGDDGRSREMDDSSSCDDGFAPAMKRGRSVEEVKSLVTSTREAIATWANHCKDDMNRTLLKHKEESVELRAKAAQLQTEITETNLAAEELVETQNERVKEYEQRQTELRAAKCALKDVGKEKERLEAAVAARTDSIAKRRATAQKQLTDAEQQIVSLQQSIDLYSQRLGLSMEFVSDSDKKGARVMKVSFTLLDPKKPSAVASCMLYIHNNAYCIDGYSPSKPEDADGIVTELNKNQDLCMAIAKLRSSFKKLLISSRS